MKRWLFWVLFWPLLSPAAVTLFKGGYAVPHYDQLVNTLKPGDVVSFSNGNTYRLGLLLGEGNTTKVFEIIGQPDRVLRIPSYVFRSPYGLKLEGTEYMRHYIQGSRELAEKGVPITEIYESHRSEYAITRRIGQDNLIPLEDFLIAEHPPKDVQSMATALRDFARRTVQFEHIADFHENQVAYDIRTRKWFLMDWTGGHGLVDKKNAKESKNIFFALREYANRGYRLEKTGERISDWGTELLNTIYNDIQKAKTKRTGCAQVIEQYLK